MTREELAPLSVTRLPWWARMTPFTILQPTVTLGTGTSLGESCPPRGRAQKSRSGERRQGVAWWYGSDAVHVRDRDRAEHHGAPRARRLLLLEARQVHEHRVRAQLFGERHLRGFLPVDLVHDQLQQLG